MYPWRHWHRLCLQSCWTGWKAVLGYFTSSPIPISRRRARKPNWASQTQKQKEAERQFWCWAHSKTEAKISNPQSSSRSAIDKYSQIFATYSKWLFILLYLSVKKQTLRANHQSPRYWWKIYASLYVFCQNLKQYFFKKKLARILHVTVCIFSKFERIFIVEKANIEIQPPQSPGSWSGGFLHYM